VEKVIKNYQKSNPMQVQIPRKVLGAIVIEQTSINTPYFTIVQNIDRKTSVNHPIPGRHVLFNTLALFIFYINKFHGGQVCRCRIASLAKTWSSRIALHQTEDDDDDDSNDE
jgi:hypothetical protein